METHEDDEKGVFYEASLRGSVATLETLIQNDPLILNKLSLGLFNETPLHISALIGHIDFTTYLLARKPQLATMIDSLNCSPLHFASAAGHIEIVQALLEADSNACLVRDQYGRIPLHYAAVQGRVEIVRALINAQPHSITREILDNGETVLHLCVKYNQLEVLKLLVESVRDDEEFLNLKGGDGGNTIFDLIVILKQIEAIRYLLSIPNVRIGKNSMKRILKVLKQFPEDFTGLAIEHFPNDAPPTTQTAPYNSDGNSQARWSKWRSKCVKHMNFNGDWLKDTRGTLMIVATVIVTMTFQPILSPPGGVWQENINSTMNGFVCGNDTLCAVGTAMLASASDESTTFTFQLFLVDNTITFFAALSVILLLISNFPIHNKVGMWLLTIAMCITLSFLVNTYTMGMGMITGYKYDSTARSATNVLYFSSLIFSMLLVIIAACYTISVLIWIVWKLTRFLIWLLKRMKRNFTPRQGGAPIN